MFEPNFPMPCSWGRKLLLWMCTLCLWKPLVRQFSPGIRTSYRIVLSLEQTQRSTIKKAPKEGALQVGPLGLEPRLFWTKTRRVASYTMDQFEAIFAQMDNKDKFNLSYMQRKM